MTRWPVTFSLPHGLIVSGITTWALRLAGALSNAGIEARLVVHPPLAGHAELPAPDPALIGRARLVRAPSLTDKTAWQACVRLYRELLPSIVMPNILAESYAVVAALATTHADQVRVAAWNHSDNPYDYAYLTHYEPLVHQYVAVSQRCADELKQRLPTRQADITRLPHGIPIPPPAERAPLAGRPIRLRYAGRMEQSVKRVMDFVRLAELLTEHRVRFDMLLVGDGPQSADLDRAIEGLHPALAHGGSCIARHSPVAPDQMERLWQQTDVVMLASSHEGLSVTLLEAMACGCVPVASRVASGVGELVDEGETGLTFPIGDITAMADCIRRLAGDESTLRRMSVAARRRAEQICAYDRYSDAVAGILEKTTSAADRPWPPSKPLEMNAPGGVSRATVPSDAEERAARVLREVARRNAGPVALYGAGGHTLALAEVWARSPVEIVAVIDDDPSAHGRRLWGWPVVAPDEAAAAGARSVIISSWMHENAIWSRRFPLEAAGLHVIRLYAPAPAAPDQEFAITRR